MINGEEFHDEPRHKTRNPKIVEATERRSAGPSNVAPSSPSTTKRESALRGGRGLTGVAEALAPLMNAVLAPQTPVHFEFWDGSGLGPVEGSGVVIVRSPEAIRQILWGPGELGLSRAYVAGNLDIEGDIYETLRALGDSRGM